MIRNLFYDHEMVIYLKKLFSWQPIYYETIKMRCLGLAAGFESYLERGELKKISDSIELYEHFIGGIEVPGMPLDECFRVVICLSETELVVVRIPFKPHIT